MILSTILLSMVAADNPWIDRKARLEKHFNTGHVVSWMASSRICRIQGEQVHKLEVVNGMRVATNNSAVIQGPVFEMLQRAEAGKLNIREIAIDGGQTTWMGFYTDENGKFHEVTLRADGDTQTMNDAPEAESLRLLLDRICGD